MNKQILSVLLLLSISTQTGHTNILFKTLDGISGAVAELLIVSNWNLTTKITTGRDSVRLYEETSKQRFNYMDPMYIEYFNELVLNPSPKVRFNIRQIIRPYYDSEVNWQSTGYTDMSFSANYKISTELGMSVEMSQRITNFGPGIPVDCPLVSMGMGGGGGFLAEDNQSYYRYSEDSLECGISYSGVDLNGGFSVTFTRMNTIFDRERNEEGLSQRDIVGTPGISYRTNLGYTWSPKFKTEITVFKSPETYVPVYYYGVSGIEGGVEGQMAGYFQTSQDIEMTNDYTVGPGMKFQFGTSRFTENRDTVSSYYGVDFSRTRAESDEGQTLRVTDKSWVEMTFTP